jgi:hypothetical protein
MTSMTMEGFGNGSDLLTITPWFWRMIRNEGRQHSGLFGDLEAKPAPVVEPIFQ